MQDYRLNLLTQLVQSKLGLVKKTTKIEGAINSILFDIKKKHKFRPLEEKEQYSSVRSRFLDWSKEPIEIENTSDNL